LTGFSVTFHQFIHEANMQSPSTDLPMDAYWMPFTANRDFKKSPRLIASAQGHHYIADDGRKLYDGFSGLWTSGIGHCHPKIVAAVQHQVAEMDLCMGFQLGHNKAFELADKLTKLAPQGLEHCFFTNSGSESVDTALKIALGYHRARGDASRTRLIGRQRGYHGVNFGGISVGGIGPNRKAFSANLINGVDHLSHTHNLQHAAFSHGQPEWGAHLAEELETLVALHDASTIAAVIVEPVAGATGILPPPLGYLERLREICTRHGILLIFDEVITGFGRVGAPFAAQRFGVLPDIITVAKGLTNGVIPMGAVLVSENIHRAFMQGPEQTVELFHGYTYSGHPIAAAASLATLEVYREEGSFEQAKELETVFAEAIHDFDHHAMVIDVRNLGLMGAIELAPRDGAPGARGLEVHKRCFWDENLVIRNSLDIIQFSPFLNSRPEDIRSMFASVQRVIEKLA
jgi:beta-alanine--pyruvate transaminase